MILTGLIAPSCANSIKTVDYSSIKPVKVYSSEFKTPKESRTLKNIYDQARALEAIKRHERDRNRSKSSDQ